MSFGKLIIVLGLIVIIIGLLIEFTPFFAILKKNPLDFQFTIGNTKIFFPLGSCILLSILIAIIMRLF